MPEPETKPVEERQPWVAQVAKDLRGDDLDMPLNDMVKTFRTVAKERDELKARPSGLVKPTEKSSPEEIAAYRKAMGVPDNPDGYDLALPKEYADIAKPEDMKSFASLVHGENIPATAAKKILDFETQRAVAARKAFVDAQNAKQKETRDKLIEKYGQKADEKLAAAFKVIEQFGGKEAVEELKEPIGNSFRLIDTLIAVGALFSERGLIPSGMGTSADGPVDLAKAYPKSAAQMGIGRA